jgi:hypothetical protein
MCLCWCFATKKSGPIERPDPTLALPPPIIALSSSKIPDAPRLGPLHINVGPEGPEGPEGQEGPSDVDEIKTNKSPDTVSPPSNMQLPKSSRRPRPSAILTGTGQGPIGTIGRSRLLAYKTGPQRLVLSPSIFSSIHVLACMTPSRSKRRKSMTKSSSEPLHPMMESFLIQTAGNSQDLKKTLFQMVFNYLSLSDLSRFCLWNRNARVFYVRTIMQLLKQIAPQAPPISLRLTRSAQESWIRDLNSCASEEAMWYFLSQLSHHTNRALLFLIPSENPGDISFVLSLRTPPTTDSFFGIDGVKFHCMSVHDESKGSKECRGLKPNCLPSDGRLWKCTLTVGNNVFRTRELTLQCAPAVSGLRTKFCAKCLMTLKVYRIWNEIDDSRQDIEQPSMSDYDYTLRVFRNLFTDHSLKIPDQIFLFRPREHLVDSQYVPQSELLYNPPNSGSLLQSSIRKSRNTTPTLRPQF